MDPPFPCDIPSTRPSCRVHESVKMTRERGAARLTEQLSNDSLDRSTSQDGKGMASIGGDDLVGRLDSSVHSDGDGFLVTSERDQ